MSAGEPLAKATFVASGESSGPRNSASVAAGSCRDPLLSYQTRIVGPRVPPPPAFEFVRNAIAPVIETENGYASTVGGANGSATGNVAAGRRSRFVSDSYTDN